MVVERESVCVVVCKASKGVCEKVRCVVKSRIDREKRLGSPSHLPIMVGVVVVAITVIQPLSFPKIKSILSQSPPPMSKGKNAIRLRIDAWPCNPNA